jgi:hypothetical protein
VETRDAYAKIESLSGTGSADARSVRQRRQRRRITAAALGNGARTDATTRTHATAHATTAPDARTVERQPRYDLW